MEPEPEPVYSPDPESAAEHCKIFPVDRKLEPKTDHFLWSWSSGILLGARVGAEAVDFFPSFIPARHSDYSALS